MLGNLIKSTALKFGFIWTMVILIKIRITCEKGLRIFQPENEEFSSLVI